MKCIRNTKTKETPIRRVPNDIAEKHVQTGEWAYCSKQDWKKTVRDAGKAE